MIAWFESALPILLFLGTFVFLLLGFPVTFTLGGSALFFAGIGTYLGVFDTAFISALPERIYGIMTNGTLIAVPLFVFMGIVLEKSKLAEELLQSMTKLFLGLRGGLAISICLIGGLLAASTGIVGATVVTMGVLSLPFMLKKKYPPWLSCGVICASGTLGQIIPPSIVLVILGDVISTAFQQAQLDMGIFSPRTVSVGDLFMGAILPGTLLMCEYILFILFLRFFFPSVLPKTTSNQKLTWSWNLWKDIFKALIPPLLLIVGVLGSILKGIATPTEAASVGAMGALLLAFLKKRLSLKMLHQISIQTSLISAMVFSILIGASCFSLVFRGFGGDELIQNFLMHHTTGPTSSFFLVMVVMFFLGFFLDFFEITFVIVPIVGPVLLKMGFDPIWLGIMIALNLQTSFLTPPFGFSLFYLRGVTPKTISTETIYKGVIPFIGIQLILLVLLWYYPSLATWLPKQLGAF